uniref:Restriction endonuclease subunit S n=1 Tax=Caldilinea aerophila TaxID=133453 RepID=A0A7C1FTJ4_9CHLR
MFPSPSLRAARHCPGAADGAAGEGGDGWRHRRAQGAEEEPDAAPLHLWPRPRWGEKFFAPTGDRNRPHPRTLAGGEAGGGVATLSTKAVDPANAGAKRYIGLEHIEPGNIRIQHFGKANDVRSLKIAFQKGDVLYGKLRPYLDKAVLAEWDGICSTDILVIKVQDGFLSEFLAYLLHTSKFIEYAVSTTTGVNHPRTSWKALQKFPIPLPPLAEQREIARILQAVDTKIAAEQARRAALEELFKTLLHQLMTGKIRVSGVIPTTVDSAESAATED